jgi:hypothetical protein
MHLCLLLLQGMNAGSHPLLSHSALKAEAHLPTHNGKMHHYSGQSCELSAEKCFCEVNIFTYQVVRSSNLSVLETPTTQSGSTEARSVTPVFGV